MIYVPELEKYECYEIVSEGVIRGYEQRPYIGNSFIYRDYYINSSYIYSDGVQEFSEGSTLPNCLSNDNLTDAFYYRLDIDKIMIVFFIFIFIIYFIFKKIVRSFFFGPRYS